MSTTGRPSSIYRTITIISCRNRHKMNRSWSIRGMTSLRCIRGIIRRLLVLMILGICTSSKYCNLNTPQTLTMTNPMVMLSALKISMACIQVQRTIQGQVMNIPREVSTQNLKPKKRKRKTRNNSP